MISGFNIAKVSQIDTSKGLLKVEYPDYGNMVSDWLGIIESIAVMPKVGQTVGVLTNPKGQGICLGTIYSERNPPAVRMIEFDTDAYIKYDSSTRTLTIKADDVNIVRDTQ